ncbi:MAG: TIGR03905 family TSCPD domain-containing protein [Oscillospiraceae bacterium]|nr:TIGR03905 family TSCPD domain-containing protein [Oscillospiraceae bacterium]
MKLTYRPKGTCSNRMDVEVEDGIIKSVVVTGGCNGNLQGIMKLVQGMPAKEVIARLSGIRCGPRSTSCPDQLAIALTKCMEAE